MYRTLTVLALTAAILRGGMVPGPSTTSDPVRYTATYHDMRPQPNRP